MNNQQFNEQQIDDEIKKQKIVAGLKIATILLGLVGAVVLLFTGVFSISDAVSSWFEIGR